MFNFNDPPALDPPDKDWSLKRLIQDRQSEESRMRVNEEFNHVKEKKPTIRTRVLKKHNWFVCLFSKKKREERKRWEARWGKHLTEAHEIEIIPMKYEPSKPTSFSTLDYTYKNTKNTMSKHTQGTWVAGYGYVDGIIGEVYGVGIQTEPIWTPICILSPAEKVNETDVANGDLIAAAPEMLEALKKALDALGGNDPHDLSYADSICGYIRAAIAKAEGEVMP